MILLLININIANNNSVDSWYAMKIIAPKNSYKKYPILVLQKCKLSYNNNLELHKMESLGVRS